jgi:hypothetical protein
MTQLLTLTCSHWRKIQIITAAFETGTKYLAFKSKNKITLHTEQYVSNQQVTGGCYKNLY